MTVATVALALAGSLFWTRSSTSCASAVCCEFNVSIEARHRAPGFCALGDTWSISPATTPCPSRLPHPAVRRGAADAALESGGGAGASRLLGGDLLVHRELEAYLAELKGTEGALLFQSGTHANCGSIPALVGEGDAIFSDALNHASIVDGCRLSRAARFIYRHGDLTELAELLAMPARRKLIITETLFSMEGDVAPLAEICDLADRHGALVMVDEAHATGVYGGGAGLCRELGLDRRVHVQMGTLGKALGASGAYVAGEARLVNFLVNRARSYIFTTALPPAACGAALAAVTLIRGPEGERRREAVRRNSALLTAELMAAGVPLTGGGDIS